MSTTIEQSGNSDGALVAAALAGDRSALADIYDRYADRIHSMCVHMLADHDEGADACGEVFLVAFQRLDGLRDPSKLRPWLYAIARHEVYRRTRRRNRITLTEEVNEMDRLRHHDIAPADSTDSTDSTDAAAIAALVRDAAAGLDDRDRLVLELQLQGLDGADLADALGTSTSTGYQQVHRMRERMERSLGALLIARQGRGDCGDLDRLLSGWDGTFSVLWRKRVARHVDSCAICERRRKAVPGALLGSAGASPLVVTPTSVRTRVLEGAIVGGGAARATGGRGWRRDGFPPPHPDRRPLGGIVPAAVAALLVLLGGLLLWAPWSPEQIDVATDRVDVSPTTTRPDPAPPGAVPSTEPAIVTTAVPAPSALDPVPETTTTAPAPSVAPPTTRRPVVPATPTTTVPVPTTPPSSADPTTTTIPSTTTTAAPATPPVVRLTGPGVVYTRLPNGAACSNEAHVATVAPATAAPVTLRWTSGAATGTVAMTRNRVRGRWTATVDVPSGTTGTLTVFVDAVAGGVTGSSNATISQLAPCPVVG